MPPGPKSANTPRRASSLSKVSTPATTTIIAFPLSARSKQTSKPSRIVRLNLPREKLSGFPHERTLVRSTKAKASPLSQSTTVATDEKVTITKVKPEPKSALCLKQEEAQPSPGADIKAENAIEPKTGEKRELGTGIDSDDKDKLKNNSRKRPKPDPSRPDGRTAAAKAMKGALGTGAGTTHKLGPKANQGAINAGLRALDRTTKACRKWERTGFKIKSFTGRVWEISSWRTPNPKAFGSESEPGTSNSQSKENSSSNVGSDKSPAVKASVVASSPAPALAISA